jgi:acetate kinase
MWQQKRARAGRGTALQGETMQPAATVTRNQSCTSDRPNGAADILTINGGSSSIKFAVFAAADPPRQLLSGIVERIGQPNTLLRAERDGTTSEEKLDGAAGHGQAAEFLIRWLQRQMQAERLMGIGHRVVHGGVHAVEHQVVTEELLAELRRTQPLDLAHLPREIGLIEAFRRRYPKVPQVACFDTAFHRDLPRVAQLLPIPRHYYEAGVRRFGFHGLSYTYLMTELERIAGPAAADGRVILAHLGAGASMAAVHRRKPVDTTMAFTPTAGLVMATRPGDLDPGLLVYMMRVQGMSPEQADEFISRRCGLIGVSETTPDMQTLLRMRESDPRAADAVALFCYQAKKWIGAYAAALGGLDTLVFAGGIGEHAPQVRAEICQGLEYMGVRLDPSRNDGGAPLISQDGAAVTVRVMHTDEELMIARAVCRLLKKPGCSETSSTPHGARNGGA